MRKRDNDLDLHLLRTDPQALVLRHQETIIIIAKKLIARGLFPASELDDLLQDASVHILDSVEEIRSGYAGIALVETYLSRIIRNCLLNIARRGRLRPVLMDVDAVDPGHNETPDRPLLIAQDVSLLGAILEQFGKDTPKIILCLKAYFRIPIRREDLLAWWPHCPRKAVNSILARLGGKPGEKTDNEVYSCLHPWIAIAEKRSSSVDSLRHWVDSRIVEIITLLNGNPPTGAHTRDTLETLFDHYCAPKS